MGYEVLRVERLDGFAVLTLNRPDVLNALNHQLTGELTEAFRELEHDDGVSAVVVTGAGERAFCAGADIHEMAATSPEEAKRRAAERKDWTWYVADYPKPTIGALNGLAYGGGAVLASTLDIRIGCERSSFRFLGAAYGRINSTWTLPLLVGWGQAKDLLLTARVVGAEEALRIGLLNRLVPAEELRAAALETAALIAKNNAESIRGVKRLLHESVGLGYRDRYDHEAGSRGTRFAVPSVQEGFKDFLSRKGRPNAAN